MSCQHIVECNECYDREDKLKAKLAEAQMQFRTMSAEAESAIREWKAKLAEAQRVIGLQAAALEVWKKAYPTVANPTARR